MPTSVLERPAVVLRPGTANTAAKRVRTQPRWSRWRSPAVAITRSAARPGEAEKVGEEKPKHRIEIFSAGCPLCRKAIDRVHQIADSSFKVEVLDMHQSPAQAQAELYSITQVPAIVVDGKLPSLLEDEEREES